MMRVVDLGDKVGDRQLQAVRERDQRFRTRREAELWTEIVQDIGDVRDDRSPSRGTAARTGTRPGAVALHDFRHRGDAAALAALARDIDVSRAGILQREPDEFAAPL